MDEQSVELTVDVIETIRSASQKLSGFARRQFQAEVAQKYCGGNARITESRFGFSRDSVATGLGELNTGIRCLNAYHQRGRKKIEIQSPQIETDIREIVEPVAQADPKFQSIFAYTRVTAAAVRTALLERDPARTDVPCRQTVGTILNRLGYRLRTVLKTKPQKKFPRRTRSSPNAKSGRLRRETMTVACDSRLMRKPK